jgi:hypothetical protein
MKDIIGDKEIYFVMRELPHMISERFLPAATENSSKDKSVEEED